MTELRRFLKAPKSQKLTLTLPMDYIQKKSFYAMCPPEMKTLMDELDKMIDQATSDYTSSESWPSIIAVVDKLNSLTDNEVRNETIRMVRMRLAHFSPTVVLSALHLTEALVKNCGRAIRQRISQPKFMQTMELLYKEHHGKVGREHIQISARVLELIQGWGEAFLPHRRDFPGFVDAYHKMCKQGVAFPTQYDASRAPVLSPPRNGGGVPGIPGTEATAPELPLPPPTTSSAFRDLPPEQTFHVANNVLEMVEDMLSESAKEQHANIFANDILLDLYQQLMDLRGRLVQVIDQEASRGGENLDKYLTLNDAIQAAQKVYQQATAKTVAAKTDSPSRKHKAEERDEKVDIEEAILSPKKAVRFEEFEDDDDDPFAAFAQERLKKVTSAVSSPPLSSSLPPEVVSMSTPAISVNNAPVVAPTLPVAAPAPSIPVADLISWDDDVVVQPAPAPVPPPAVPRNPFDDLFPAPPSMPQPVQQPPPPLLGRKASSNPFDMI
ncbi:unnamed protein product [Aphanomyces euteiches]|nr:hypothetical protein Ae201684P_019412 [Aphanomyces euteiches]KAH9143797.1 hypothetical protein AeRB84_012225 [Aphanomyces euteiches]